LPTTPPSTNIQKIINTSLTSPIQQQSLVGNVNVVVDNNNNSQQQQHHSQISTQAQSLFLYSQTQQTQQTQQQQITNQQPQTPPQSPNRHASPHPSPFTQQVNSFFFFIFILFFISLYFYFRQEIKHNNFIEVWNYRRQIRKKNN